MGRRGEPRGRRGGLSPTWPVGRARSRPPSPGRAGPGLAASELVSGAASLPLAGRSNTLPAGHRKQTVTWAGGRRAGAARAEGTPIPSLGCRGVPPAWGLSGLPVSARLVGPLSASVRDLLPAAPTGTSCGSAERAVRPLPSARQLCPAEQWSLHVAPGRGRCARLLAVCVASLYGLLALCLMCFALCTSHDSTLRWLHFTDVETESQRP